MQGWHGSLNRLQSGRTYGESLALLVHVHDGAYCIFCFVAFPNVSVAKYVNDASVRAARVVGQYYFQQAREHAAGSRTAARHTGLG
jgi:hypothetical protein